MSFDDLHLRAEISSGTHKDFLYCFTNPRFVLMLWATRSLCIGWRTYEISKYTKSQVEINHFEKCPQARPDVTEARDWSPLQPIRCRASNPAEYRIDKCRYTNTNRNTQIEIHKYKLSDDPANERRAAENLRSSQRKDFDPITGCCSCKNV